MVTNKKTSLEKYALALFYILLNCPSYICLLRPHTDVYMEEQHRDHGIARNDCGCTMNHSIYSAPLLKNSNLELRASKSASGLFVLGSSKRLSKH